MFAARTKPISLFLYFWCCGNFWILHHHHWVRVSATCYTATNAYMLDVDCGCVCGSCSTGFRTISTQSFLFRYLLYCHFNFIKIIHGHLHARYSISFESLNLKHTKSYKKNSKAEFCAYFYKDDENKLKKKEKIRLITQNIVQREKNI